MGDEFEARPSYVIVLALAVELDDARSALEWAATNGHAQLGGELFVSTVLWSRLGRHREALDIAERYAHLPEAADPSLSARILVRLGMNALKTDDASILLELAELEHARSETRRAIAHAREALAAVGTDRSARTDLLINLPAYLLAVDALGEARDAGRAALEFLRKADPDGIPAAIAVETMALAAALGDNVRCAARLEGYADARMRAAGYECEFTERTTHERLRALLHERLPAAKLDALLAEGAAWPAQNAITEALRIASSGAIEAVP
ncbi:MAG: hypothetical protein M3R44_05785 [Candidatus Eremiobacteraeota bacterium]|nr:hypothetical protein [Candidatus Eremiobacteraeota bacterium]